ncbi:recombinase family protein [Clostridium saccharobutylicum]|uniref:recombinase family protein n=1 Tax=Clostridium saccharobutylicum TaxID=169679 RepID=UPI00162340F6|nr:recombinase family protein [Clostridium saccharobutylicum]MBC2464749.1 recombinase family protein [Clostridium saccharobutylicum]
MIVKYLRVSTKKQDTGRQDIQLDKLGIKFDKEYIDKMTGKTNERHQLNKMLLELTEGDTVYSESISRLGRSLKDLIDIVERLINKGVRVVIVKEGIDTNSSTYKLLLGIFGGVAEMERETIQERVIQGIEKCRATGETKTGRWFGREAKNAAALPKDFKKYYNKMINKEISKVEMSKLLGVGRATLYRWIKLYETV